MQKKDIEILEIELLIEALHRCHGYDFKHYAKASLKRRLQHILEKAKLQNFSELLPKVLYDSDFFSEFLVELSVTATEMFRDPEFYIAFREKVVPVLKTYPFIKIWHAGCATGEEVYSMAMLLHESDLLDRTQLYGTDFNLVALKIASQGIYSINCMEKYAQNYKNFSNKALLSDYYHEKYNSIKMSNHLKKHITFSHHNLAIDYNFGEMNIVICRNVLIYFDSMLQNRALGLFKESLMPRGFLCLGNKENLINTNVNLFFETVEKKQKIYRLTASERTL
ncbi:MAG: protein-glutamate O-methyltransferase CheR [Gammaproteobacteria bacterium]|nr:protein-glutamate O-methyltransferase CheR [Gammaproteobacteria bacterium]